MFEHVLTHGFEPTMSISKSVLHIHWLPMFLHLFNTVFEKLLKQTKLPNLCPNPPSFLQWYLHFAMVFLHCCFNGTTGPKQPIKSTKNKFAPLKWENWQRVRSRSFAFVLFCQPFKKPTTNQKTRNQETKKLKKTKHPKNKNKKPKKQETKKKQNS